MARKPTSINKLYVGDNLDVMHGMNSNSVDLIYLDPPFNSKRMYRAPTGSSADKKAAMKGKTVGFHDVWIWEQDVDIRLLSFLESHPDLFTYIDLVGKMNGQPLKTYLTFMAQRLIETHRLLKDTGSIYLHCDPAASHYLKLVLDFVFGKENFINEIIWYYTNASRGKKKLANAHDVILWYSKTQGNYTFNRDAVLQKFDSGMTKWRYTKGGQAGQAMPTGKTPDDVFILPSLNAMSKERTGYPTQKPLALLDRIIQASSNKDDLVIDPFCGCATTCVSAQNHHRNWIGIDLEEITVDLVVDRLTETEEGQKSIQFNDFIASRTPPTRTDLAKLTWSKKKIRDHFYGKQGGYCKACEKHFENIHLEIDHTYPESLGGAWTLGNLQLLCGNCNRTKGDRPLEFLRARLAEHRKRQKAIF